MHPFIFFKAQGGPLKEADLAKKNLQRETETQFETVTNPGAAENAENVLTHTESCRNRA